VSAPGEASEQILTPRILDHVRLDVNQAVRLNVGCGHIPHPDKLNVDRRELPGVDVIADADNLPFEPASIDLIYAAHLLEHFPRRYLLDVLLPYWGSLLKSDGVLQLVVPDAQAMLAAYKREEMSFATLTEVTFGKQDYDGDFHYAMYSPQTLTELLSEAGFGQIEVLADDRINGDCREMEIQARKS
jgi:predicted SAM-dependent methyltransferase